MKMYKKKLDVSVIHTNLDDIDDTESRKFD